MKVVLPKNLEPEAFASFLAESREILGLDGVLADDRDRDEYRDSFAFADDETHIPSGSVAPTTTTQVQAILRAAGRHGVPLWPFSRGKNLAYGGSAPRMSGTVMLDMSRMRKIIEVNSDLGFAVLEPGVGFYDLFGHLRNNNIPLWVSCPEQSWGSVVGNALDRGMGRTPYGEHTHSLCGMEVVLPDGDIVRTGMGAMPDNKTWHVYRTGFGPGWDQMFAQSNYGVVTKAGIWLMPQPKATSTLSITAMEDEDFEWLVPRLIALTRDRIIDQFFTLINCFMLGPMLSERADWYDLPGPIPRDVIKAKIRKLGIGWWNSEITVYGDPSVNAAKMAIMRKMLEGRPSIRLDERHWDDSMPVEKSAMSVPSTFAMQFINWYGGRGGHMDFSPALPSRSEDLIRHVRDTQKLFDAAGQDFTSANHITGRYTISINVLIYDRDNKERTRTVRTLFSDLIDAAAVNGYGEYRTHLDWMDKVAASYGYNNQALRRLNERVKDALDPNGILAPGKSGIWPERYRGERGA